MDGTQISAIIDASDLWIFGVRALHADEMVLVGDTIPESYVWDDGDRTDESIGGACCFEIREGDDPTEAIRRATKYNLSGRYALLGGKYMGNNDLIAETHTIAIRDAVVLAVWS
jgi:hypothetical protein